MNLTRIVIVTLSLCSFLSPVLAEKETDPRKLVTMASEAYDSGSYETCGMLYAQAIEHGAKSSGVPYNAACCYALNKDAEQAFEFLVAVVEDGFRDVGLLESDTDLAGLHDDERWTKLIQQVSTARDTYAKAHNQELLTMYEEDQGDRSGAVGWSVVAARDEKRRQRVKEMLAAGEVQSADDHFHAAMVLQHGHGPEDYKLAHELSLKASEMDAGNSTVRWLAAAAKDRYLHSIDEPQIYGTQYHLVDGKWTMEPMDESAVTDEERARWGVPPLAEARAREKAMNTPD